MSFSRLGFGCANLPGRLALEQALALIEAALDAGICHFDVARMYGDGRAEAVLGEAAKRWRERMTIVTKAGISPASRALLARGWRKAKAAIPALADLAPPAIRTWGDPHFHRFAAADVRDSLETSLRELKTDHVDALLLHECAVGDASDELKHELERLREAGKIARWGLASSPADTADMVAAYPDLCGIVQVPADACTIARPPGSHLVLHTVLSNRFASLSRRLSADESLSRRYEAEVGPRAGLGSVFLADAMARSPDATILFSSANPENIRRNARLLTDFPSEELSRFHAFIAGVGAR